MIEYGLNPYCAGKSKLFQVYNTGLPQIDINSRKAEEFGN